MGNESPPGDERRDDPDGERPDELLAAAQELAGAGEDAPRPRMRRGRVRRRGRTISEDGAEELAQPTGVKSTADESDQPDVPPEAPPAREMLDATGAVLPPAASALRPTTARAIDAGAVLAEAVRSYLDGLDDRGADDPVTQDRLDRLRRTLEQYDRAT